MEEPTCLSLSFGDNRIAASVFGPRNVNLEQLERILGVDLATRGDTVTITGNEEKAETARTAMMLLMRRAQLGLPPDRDDVDAAARMAERGEDAQAFSVLMLRTRKRVIFPRTPTQSAYIRAMQSNDLVFGHGPAGTGKTYLAVATAVTMKLKGDVDRIVLCRPAVEAGERLGFLPGDMREKIDPYLRPLYDALQDMLPGEALARALENREIEVAPLAFMRGRTLAGAFVILDEAQNATPVQMKMFLTRLGKGARMVVTGDLSQIDLPQGSRSGLRDALEVLSGTAGIGVVAFGKDDVVRHDLVARIVRAYEKRETLGRTAGDEKEQS